MNCSTSVKTCFNNSENKELHPFDDAQLCCEVWVSCNGQFGCAHMCQYIVDWLYSKTFSNKIANIWQVPLHCKIIA